MKTLLLAAKVLMHTSELIEITRMILRDRVRAGEMCAQDYVLKSHLDILEDTLKRLEAI